ncbi:hypothetical protein M758_11G096600 [Ceratodon purpureus]|nr:hypothetical protein M758_11G096600 [Ceratodon purpureus]
MVLMLLLLLLQQSAPSFHSPTQPTAAADGAPHAPAQFYCRSSLPHTAGTQSTNTSIPRMGSHVVFLLQELLQLSAPMFGRTSEKQITPNFTYPPNTYPTLI